MGHRKSPSERFSSGWALQGTFSGFGNLIERYREAFSDHFAELNKMVSLFQISHHFVELNKMIDRRKYMALHSYANKKFARIEYGIILLIILVVINTSANL